jgi:hypothetical protein
VLPRSRLELAALELGVSNLNDRNIVYNVGTVEWKPNTDYRNTMEVLRDLVNHRWWTELYNIEG